MEFKTKQSILSQLITFKVIYNQDSLPVLHDDMVKKRDNIAGLSLALYLSISAFLTRKSVLDQVSKMPSCSTTATVILPRICKGAYIGQLLSEGYTENSIEQLNMFKPFCIQQKFAAQSVKI